MKKLITVLSLTSTLSIAGAATLKFGGPINGSQEVPPVEGTSAAGSAVLTLDTETLTYDLKIDIAGLPETINAAHIHSAPVGVNGGVIVNLLDEEDESFEELGSFKRYSVAGKPFDPAGLASLFGGDTYLNFHTDAFPGGEVRGQLLPIEESSDALVNFSTRGMVNPGNGKAGLLIGGLALQERKTILFRMVADSLTRFGVQTSLKDTSFEVYQLPFGDLETAELVGGNDNWKESGQQFQILGTGYAPAFDNESAVIMTLDPGVYTMNADSEQGAGIALVETYGIETVSLEEFVSQAAGGELSQEFTILSAAITVAELEGFLAGPGPFTLFAPTDSAFAAASLTQEGIEAMSPEDVALLLLAHIAGGAVTSSDLTEDVPLMVEALDGGEREVLLDDGVITVDNATVLEGDISGSNGVVHIIDAVIATE